MSEIERETSTTPHQEAHNSLFLDAYNFGADTIKHPDARARQACVAAYGAVIGGITDIPNEIRNHPVETAQKAAIGVAAGLGTAALLTTNSPWIAGGTLVGGGLLLGVALKNSWDKACNNVQLSKALSATWKNGDLGTTLDSMKIAEKQLGEEGFDYGLSAIAGGVGAKFSPSLIAKIANEFGPRTVWKFSPRPNWVKQADGTRTSIDPKDGEVLTQYADGTIKESLSKNPTVTYHPEGGSTWEYSSGIKVTDMDNHTTVNYPDGKQMTTYAYGDREIKLPNGTTIFQSAWGDLDVKKADGSSFKKQTNGGIYHGYPNGDYLEVNPAGKKVFYNAAEREYYEIKSNGERVLINMSSKRK